jgi:peptidyl-prolyl cis-trans isomerase D
MATHRKTRGPVFIWGRNIMVGLVALTFVVLFGLPTGGGGPRSVAMVDGVIVERDAFEFFRRTNEDRQRPAVPANFDPVRFRELVDELTRNQLIQRYALAAEAERLGLRVSHAEVLEEIRSDLGFRVNGRFDADVFDTFIARSEFDNETSYLAQLRHDLLIRKLRRLLQSPIRISEPAVRDRLVREQTSLRLHYATARAADFAGRQAPDEAQIDSLVLSAPDRLQSAYASRYDEFNQPERVRARHILFRGDDAEQNANQAYQRIRAGEDFVALAGELSEDAATRDRGGDLGTFPRGRMLPEVDAAAFGAEARSAVGPVRSERGVHLIRVEEKLPAVSRPLPEVQRELARELLAAEGAVRVARRAADEMAGRLAAGVAFDEAARQSGLPVEQTTPFRADSPAVPGIGRVPGLRQAAFALREDAPASTRVFATPDAFYLISLAERRQPDPEAIREELPAARANMQTAARNAAFARLSSRLHSDLQAGGKIVLYDLYPDPN